MPLYRRIFPSFVWEDKKYVNQIIQQPKIVGDENLGFESGVPSEEVRKNDQAIRRWIQEKMKICSCLVLFVGEDTWTSKWCRYEFDLAGELGKGRLLVWLDGMTDPFYMFYTCGCGIDPLTAWGMNYDQRTGLILRKHWKTDNGQRYFANWIEIAISESRKATW